MCEIKGNYARKRAGKICAASILIVSLIAGICIPSGTNLLQSKADSISKKDVLKAVREARSEVLYEKSHSVFSQVDIDEEDIEEIEGEDGAVNIPQVANASKKCGVEAVRENPDYGYKGDETVVAVIDTGVNYKHKDMVLSEGAKTKFSEDEWKKKISKLGYGKYYTEKVPFGYDYMNNKNEGLSTTENYHGYHVAGIVGANGTVQGVAPNTQILSMNTLGGGLGGGKEELVRSIEDAVTLGADVINMSLGSKCGLNTEEDYTQKAIETASKAGVLVCVSAGNDGTSAGFGGSDIDLDMVDTATVGSPGTAKSCLTVASADLFTEDNLMAPYTSWGAGNDLSIKPEISAPGDSIQSTYTGDSYEYLSGTSMAAPFVSGCAALVINDIKKNNISLDGQPLKGEKLTSYIKSTLMNTSKPIEDIDNYDKVKGIPYSIRRQGAGLVNVENALKNRVIATCDNQAKIEIGEVSNKGKTFTIALTNYGDTDATYTVESSDVYRNIQGKKTSAIINDNAASISFNAGTITVPAKKSVEVTGTLKVSSAYKENSFIEAYITFTGDNVVDLSMPLLGFYGSWTAEPIVDYPIYDGKESYLESIGAKAVSIDGVEVSGDGKLRSGTGLMDYDKSYNNPYLGMVVKGDSVEYNSELCAFSPDDNYIRDSVSVGITNIRSIKEIKMTILDENKEHIRTVGIANDIRKKSYLELCQEPYSKLQALYTTLGDELIWDGKVYDESKDKYVRAKDGQYYVQLEIKISEKFAPQIITMPVKVETQAPKVTDFKLEDNNVLNFKVEENLAMDSFYYVYLDGEVIPFAMDSLKVDEEGNYEIDFGQFEGEEVWLVLNDIAGNEVTKKIKTNSTDEQGEEEVDYDVEEEVIDDYSFDLIFDESIVEKSFIQKETNLVSILLKNMELDKIEFDVKAKEGYTIKDVYIEAEKAYEESDNCGMGDEEEIIEEENIDEEMDMEGEGMMGEGMMGEGMMGNIEHIVGTKNADGSYHFVLDSKLCWRFLSIHSVSNTGSSYYMNANIHTYDGEAEFYNDLSFNECDALSGNYEGEIVTDDMLNEDGIYTFKGKFNILPDVFTINGEEVTVDSNTYEFTYSIPISGGINVAKLHVKNKYREYDVDKKFIYSRFKVTLDNIVDEGKVIKCNSEFFNVKGMIESYITGYTIRINNDIMYSATTYYDVVAGRRGIDTKKFDYNIKLKDGVNTIKIVVTNHRNETITKTLQVEKTTKMEE